MAVDTVLITSICDGDPETLDIASVLVDKSLTHGDNFRFLFFVSLLSFGFYSGQSRKQNKERPITQDTILLK